MSLLDTIQTLLVLSHEKGDLQNAHLDRLAMELLQVCRLLLDGS